MRTPLYLSFVHPFFSLGCLQQIFLDKFSFIIEWILAHYNHKNPNGFTLILTFVMCTIKLWYHHLIGNYNCYMLTNCTLQMFIIFFSSLFGFSQLADICDAIHTHQTSRDDFISSYISKCQVGSYEEQKRQYLFNRIHFVQCSLKEKSKFLYMYKNKALILFGIGIQIWVLIITEFLLSLHEYRWALQK